MKYPRIMKWVSFFIFLFFIPFLSCNQKIDRECPDSDHKNSIAKELTLGDSAEEKSIKYEVKDLSDRAEQILKKNNPKLKQLHIIGDDVGTVMNTAIERLPQKYRETMIVIFLRPIIAIDESSGCCKVYNIIGDKDCCLKMRCENLSGPTSNMHIETVPQTEAESQIRGQCMMQSKYLRKVSQIILQEVSKNYEIY
jgi:hypothetical protein